MKRTHLHRDVQREEHHDIILHPVSPVFTGGHNVLGKTHHAPKGPDTETAVRRVYAPQSTPLYDLSNQRADESLSWRHNRRWATGTCGHRHCNTAKFQEAQQCAVPAPRRLVNFPFVQRAARGQNSLRLRPPQHRAQTHQAREPFFGTVAA